MKKDDVIEHLRKLDETARVYYLGKPGEERVVSKDEWRRAGGFSAVGGFFTDGFGSPLKPGGKS